MPAPLNYDEKGELLADNKKLFIANLGYRTNTASLRSFFSQYGEVQFAKVVYDNKGESRGFGFVWMKKVEDCHAISKISNPDDPLEKGGFTIDGRHGVHCSFHNTRKTGTTMETQSINEAKKMASMAAAAAHAQLAKSQQADQQRKQFQYPYAAPSPPAYPHQPGKHPPPFAAPPSIPIPPSSSFIPPPSAELPPQFRCSIDGELMEDPVIAVDGYSYERFNLERYLRSNDTSPKTGAHLSSKSMMPNIALKEMIGSWIRQRSGSEHPTNGASLSTQGHQGNNGYYQQNSS
eukprot:CAMPEP_0118645886 /NCGR_PEP_ID=MMETSP0785-20121206/7749_1 /TAXON_ID=91992 /ORGANISM="Bolidomonas pacifica, Strain CCMP 1866" /LENGTH=290 /DNA_ID=CAMNT_0006537817 /DNA_START=199 /DNA_END=1067 /DNA_ORIENTATION=-